jgi:hypothetical protein
MRKRNLWLVLPSISLLVVTLSCNLLASAPSQAAPTDTPPEASPTSLPPTATLTEAPTQTFTPVPSDTPPEPTATSGPMCTVLQDLNFRSGPGTAYRPPVRAFPANTQLIPLAYNPTGIPGGPWVQVKEEGGNETGWVSAGEQFVSCNIDLTSLPSANVAPPPPPPPPKTDNSTPEGDAPDNLVSEADFNSQYFVRMRAHDTDEGEKDGDGIDHVTFQVKDADGNLVYERTENTAGYCIFGGGEPECNPWTLENYVYKWKPGGEAVKEGKYELAVHIEATNGDQGNWTYQVELKLP